MPGMPKMDSIRMEPVKMSPSCVPAMVMMGMRALRRPCLRMMTHFFTPLASAVRMKSCERTSSMEVRVTRAIEAA